MRRHAVSGLLAGQIALVIELPAFLAVLSPVIEWNQYTGITLVGSLFVLWLSLTWMTLAFGRALSDAISRSHR